MKKTLFWRIITMMIGIYILSVIPVFAQTNIEIMPKVNSETLANTNTDIQKWAWHVRDRYNKQASELDTATQIASGVMTRDTLFNYGVIVLKFLSQAGLLVGALMFIYTGYKYIMSVITGDWDPSKDLIKHAIYGILIIIFSYAIMRILTRAFLT
jgi:hypothetical protein